MPKRTMVYGTTEEVEAAFYDALSRADLDAMMALWAEDEEIFCIHPGAARLIGHAAIRASWQAIFERGGVRIQPAQRHVSQNMLTAVHSLIEEIQENGATPTDVHVLATNVYLKTAEGWRMVSHHASLAPGTFAGDRPVSAFVH